MLHEIAIQKLQAASKKTMDFRESHTLFPAGLTADRSFRDVDELAAAVRQWDEEGIQLVPGPFCARLNLVHTSALQIQRVRLSGAILVRGSAVPGSVVFGMQTGGSSPAIWHGRPLEPDTVVAFDGRTEIDFQTTCPSEITVVAVEECLLARQLEARYGPSIVPHASGDRLKILSPARKESLIRCWSEQTDFALAMSHCLTDDHFARRLETTVIEALQVNSWRPEHQPGLTERRRVAHRARSHMLLHMDQPMTITDICRAVGSAERTLHLGFQECFGITPKKFLKVLRLNAARRSLKHPEEETTVTGVALQWGFFHVARFARDYRRMFAETPSETLQRIRGMDAG